MLRSSRHKARSRPCGGGFGEVNDRPWQAIEANDSTQALRPLPQDFGGYRDTIAARFASFAVQGSGEVLA